VSETYISAELRRRVAARASRRCEYCLIHEQDTFFGCQVDHIISEKHGGLTTEDNLAYACAFCNRNKGSDLGTLDAEGRLVRLFDPRRDAWSDHFAFDGLSIGGRSPKGEATVRLLGFNDAARIQERRMTTLQGHD